MVIWLIGLSASGKTTIGRRLQALLDSPRQRWLLVDGDAFREVMGDAGHDMEERRKNAYRISRLCRFLELQNINVIACVLSLFPDNREFNRGLFAEYREVYVKVPMEKLADRDNKNLYAAAQAGKLKDVAGVDLHFPEPTRPDFILDNGADTGDFTALARQVAQGLGLDPRRDYAYPRAGHAPEKYQYAPFEGPEFLAGYRAQRERVLTALSEKAERLEQSFSSLAGTHYLAGKYFLSAQAGYFLSRELPEAEAAAAQSPALLTTRGFLLAALKDGRISAWDGLSGLLKRFEVTKKVHSAYKLPEWRKAEGAEERILDRILLSLALLEASASARDKARALIAFNAAIKLNDLLAADVGSLATPGEFYLAKAALAAELSLFSGMPEASHA